MLISCSDLSPTQLEVNDIYGRLIDMRRKVLWNAKGERSFHNIKNRYEE